MKRLSILLISIISTCSLSSCGPNYDEIDYDIAPLAKYTFSKIDENTMPISGWAGPDSSFGLNTFEQFKNAKDAGLNMIYGGLGDRIWGNDNNLAQKRQNIYKSLEFASENDILFFPIDHGINNLNKEETIAYLSKAQYEQYDSFAGLLVWDEPQYYQINEIKILKDNYYSYYDKDTIFYVNLNPSYVDDSLLNGRTYQTYLEDYVSITNAPFFSYDFYPEFGQFPNMRSDYFLNLVYASRVSRAFNVPFWNFVLSTSHKVGNGVYRLPTEGELYWQVSTSLAYGCKGFQYFCFMTPNGDDYLTYPGSIVNEKGERTSIFPYIQNANSAIGYFDHILINSTLIGLMSCGEGSIRVFSPFPTGQSNNRDIASFSSTQNGILSIFSYGKKTAYLITNNDFELSNTLDAEFSRGIIGNLIYFDGSTSSFKGDCLSINLAPGECILLEVLN